LWLQNRTSNSRNVAADNSAKEVNGTPVRNPGNPRSPRPLPGSKARNQSRPSPGQRALAKHLVEFVLPFRVQVCLPSQGDAHQAKSPPFFLFAEPEVMERLISCFAGTGCPLRIRGRRSSSVSVRSKGNLLTGISAPIFPGAWYSTFFANA